MWSSSCQSGRIACSTHGRAKGSNIQQRDQSQKSKLPCAMLPYDPIPELQVPVPYILTSHLVRMTPIPHEETPPLEPTKVEEVTSEVAEECLLTKAEMFYQEDKVFEAATILKSVDPDTLENKHHAMLKRAEEAENLVKELKSNPEGGGWIDRGVSTGKFPTRILYRLEESDSKTELRARCETPIKKELLSSLLSVLNESELYETWLPSFSYPRFKVREVKKLKQSGRVSQILIVVMDLPWPISSREVVLSASAFDDIEAHGHIGIKLKNIETKDDDVVPEPDPKCVRVDVDGGFLFETCPKDHPTIKFIENDSGEEMILVSFSAVMNPNMKGLPQSLLNFLVKTALGTMWKMLLQIAQDVKDGKRPDHASAIERKKEELYDYINGRVDVMLSVIKNMDMAML